MYWWIQWLMSCVVPQAFTIVVNPLDSRYDLVGNVKVGQRVGAMGPSWWVDPPWEHQILVPAIFSLSNKPMVAILLLRRHTVLTINYTILPTWWVAMQHRILNTIAVTMGVFSVTDQLYYQQSLMGNSPMPNAVWNSTLNAFYVPPVNVLPINTGDSGGQSYYAGTGGYFTGSTYVAGPQSCTAMTGDRITVQPLTGTQPGGKEKRPMCTASFHST